MTCLVDDLGEVVCLEEHLFFNSDSDEVVYGIQDRILRVLSILEIVIDIVQQQVLPVTLGATRVEESATPEALFNFLCEGLQLRPPLGDLF